MKEQTKTAIIVEEPEPKRRKLAHMNESPEKPDRSERVEKVKHHKVKNHVPDQLKDGMSKEAQNNYNNMIEMLFGKK